MRAGIIAGSATAVVAVLLSLPLHAPSDTLFNSASVAAGAVAAGVIAGLLWGALPAGPLRLPRFAAAEAALFAVTAVALVAGETQLERMVEFGLPLATLIFAVTGLLTPALDRMPLPARWPAPAALVVAIALGIVLVGEGEPNGAARSRCPRLRPAAASARTPTPAPSPASPAAAAASPSPSPSPAATASSAAAPITLAVNSHDDVAGVTFVVGEGSEVTFTVNEQLSRLPLPNDAVVRTDALSGSIHLDGRPSVVEIDLRQLESDQSRRDQYIHNRMFRSDPIATLTFDELPALPQSYNAGRALRGRDHRTAPDPRRGAPAHVHRGGADRSGRAAGARTHHVHVGPDQSSAPQRTHRGGAG